jgi:hypothetical protein
MYGYTNGDLVRVLRGPCEGFSGTVVGIDGDRLVVDVEVYGRSTPLLLPPGDVTRIDRGEDDGGSGVREPRGPSDPGGFEATDEIEIEDVTP